MVADRARQVAARSGLWRGDGPIEATADSVELAATMGPGVAVRPARRRLPLGLAMAAWQPAAEPEAWARPRPGPDPLQPLSEHGTGCGVSRRRGLRAVPRGDRPDLSRAPDGAVDVHRGRGPARGERGGLRIRRSGLFGPAPRRPRVPSRVPARPAGPHRRHDGGGSSLRTRIGAARAGLPRRARRPPVPIAHRLVRRGTTLGPGAAL